MSQVIANIKKEYGLNEAEVQYKMNQRKILVTTLRLLKHGFHALFTAHSSGTYDINDRYLPDKLYVLLITARTLSKTVIK